MSQAIPNSQVAVLSFLTRDFQPLHDITGPVKDAYCQRHGYKHIVRYSPYKKEGLYYAFDRLYFLRDLLFGETADKHGIQAVLVINTHAQIVNHNVLIQDFFDDLHDFYISKDINGLNAGVFIVRKSEWLKTWLDFLLAMEDRHHSHCWKEQYLMQQNWEKPEFVDHIKIVPHDPISINAYLYDHYNLPETTEGHHKPGDFVLHVPGKSTKVGLNKDLLHSRIELFSSAEVTSRIIW